MQIWFYSPSTAAIGYSKFAFLYMDDDEFEEQFGQHFTPYFQGLKGIAKALRKIVAAASATEAESGEVHDKIIAIFAEAAESFPDTDDMSSVDTSGTDPSTEFPRKGPAFKRQRDIEEPSNFIPIELSPKFSTMNTTIGTERKRKRVKVNAPSNSEQTRRKDVFD